MSLLFFLYTSFIFCNQGVSLSECVMHYQGRSQNVPKGGAKSGKGKSRAKNVCVFLCKRDQNRTKTVKR